MHPLHELLTFCASWLIDLRPRRDYRTILEVEALQDIATDACRDAQARAVKAFRARALDDEAGQILARLTAPDSPGGALIVRAELPDFRRAQRCIQRSATLDHELSEKLQPAKS